MILIWLIAVLIIGGILAALVERVDSRLPRLVSFVALFLDAGLLVWGWLAHASATTAWPLEFRAPWIQELGITFHLATDGLSLILVLLTFALGLLSLIGWWSEVEHKKGFFHLNLLWTLAGVTGVFLALDLFLFYFFWELMLVPMYFMIAVWGHEDRFFASVKFFIFTQLGGLFLLVAIVGLYFVHGRSTGVYSFDYPVLLGTRMDNAVSLALAAGFLIAFLVKLPAFPFHTWLPDAHTQAPTTGSVLLAGLLLKTGAYGILRFGIPLFPATSATISGVVMALAAIGILYGAVLSFAQDDVKRFVAYTSVSHMGFVLLGIFSGNELAMQGAIILIICHALSTGGLFMLVGVLQDRLATRNLNEIGGLWSIAPRLGGIWLFFALASLGLPGIGNFLGEFMVLLGTYAVNPVAAIAGAIGFIAATIYALWMVQRVLFGMPITGTTRSASSPVVPSPGEAARRAVPSTPIQSPTFVMADLGGSETLALGIMIAALVWIGLYPQPILDLSKRGLANIAAAAMWESGGQAESHKRLGLRPALRTSSSLPPFIASCDQVPDANR